jgi:hypothetical protein
VVFFGITIHNALHEMEEGGSPLGAGGKTRNKYTLKQLLEPGFILPGGDDDEDDLEEILRAQGMIYDEVGE